MIPTYLAIFIDVLLLCLLIAAMVFAIVLNNRLSRLSLEQEDLAKAAQAFNDAVKACQDGIITLRGSVETQTNRFAQQLTTAEKLNQDIAKVAAKANTCQESLTSTTAEGQKILDHLKVIAASVPSVPKKQRVATKKTTDKLDKLR